MFELFFVICHGYIPRTPLHAGPGPLLLHLRMLEQRPGPLMIPEPKRLTRSDSKAKHLSVRPTEESPLVLAQSPGLGRANLLNGVSVLQISSSYAGPTPKHLNAHKAHGP